VSSRQEKSRSAPARDVQPQLRISFKKSIAMGPGKAELLDAIDATGSISAAARKLGMSYRRAWLLVDTMNSCFRAPVVETLTGGVQGGGARVTEFGRQMVQRYREMERKAASSVAQEMAEFSHLMHD
jgi:molybdate transport system regulatory protein